MPLTIPELDKKWKTESEKYRTHEVGSGTQKFVKDVLESNNLFSLSQGKLSTSLAKRKNEFTEESRAKAGRKADVLIYIDQDIIIPVEIEKYGHIEAGEEQLKNYQTDFDKQYGIL
ncbi:MAG TPA: hypothetical protein VEH48_00300, partial [Candidatus Nitrosopolaris sp.]|nr:hypothetical protein [Candidatus Nitrosopolaris sp.]